MTFKKDLQTKKADALAAYKLAKSDFLATVTKENPNGNSDKWIAFCKCESACMMLGCII